MDELPQSTMEHMAETIEKCLETGNCSNGVKLSKEAFELMYALACGLQPDAVNREV
jgi:hypothetical protein